MATSPFEEESAGEWQSDRGKGQRPGPATSRGDDDDTQPVSVDLIYTYALDAARSELLDPSWAEGGVQDACDPAAAGRPCIPDDRQRAIPSTAPSVTELRVRVSSLQTLHEAGFAIPDYASSATLILPLYSTPEHRYEASPLPPLPRSGRLPSHPHQDGSITVEWLVERGGYLPTDDGQMAVQPWWCVCRGSLLGFSTADAAPAHHDQPEQPPLPAAALLDEYSDLGVLHLDELETIVIAPLVRRDQKLLHAPLPVLGVQMRASG